MFQFSGKAYLNYCLLVICIYRKHFQNTTCCKKQLLICIASHDADQFCRSTRCQNNQLAFLVSISQNMKTVLKKTTRLLFIIWHIIYIMYKYEFQPVHLINSHSAIQLMTISPQGGLIHLKPFTNNTVMGFILYR